MYTQLLTYETCGITNAMVKRKLICLTRAKKGKRLLVEPQFFIRKTRNSQPKSTQCARAPSLVHSMRRMDERVCVWERRHDRDYDFSMTIDGTLVSVENTIITHYSYGSIQFVSFFSSSSFSLHSLSGFVFASFTIAANRFLPISISIPLISFSFLCLRFNWTISSIFFHSLTHSLSLGFGLRYWSWMKNVGNSILPLHCSTSHIYTYARQLVIHRSMVCRQ